MSFEAIIGIASSPATGRTVDLSDATEFDKPSKVVKAAFMGHCTMEEAGLESSRAQALRGH